MPQTELKPKIQPPAFATAVQRMNQSSGEEAERLFCAGEKVGFVRTAVKMIHRFFKVYVLRGGVFCGFQGFQDATNAALFQLLVYAKYWERVEREKGRM
jgi:hypothetical protein